MGDFGEWIKKFTYNEYETLSDKTNQSPKSSCSNGDYGDDSRSSKLLRTPEQKFSRLKKGIQNYETPTDKNTSQKHIVNSNSQSDNNLVTNENISSAAEEEASSNVIQNDTASKCSEENSPLKEVSICLEFSSTMSIYLQEIFHCSAEAIGNGRTFFTKVPSTALTIKNEVSSYHRLKDYQLIGVQWLLALHEKQCNGILADEMGLGKTVQTIMFLALLYIHRKSLVSSTVIACPATLVDNWCAELKNWAPDLQYIKYHGNQANRFALAMEFSKLYQSKHEHIHIIITSLQTLTRSKDRSLLFKKYKFDYLIIDEAHHLKNSESQLYRSISKLCKTARHRLFLTGSPIQNEIAELQNLLLLLLPNPFIDAHHVGSALNALNAENTKDSSSLQHVVFLQQVFSSLILRRLKKEVEDNLPIKTSIIERCTLDSKQEQLYMKEINNAIHSKELKKSLKRSLAAKNDLKKAPSQTSTKKNNIQFNLMFRLRKICNHPLLCRGSFYTAEQLERVAAYFHRYVQGYREHSYDFVKEETVKWSDFETYQAIYQLYDENTHPSSTDLQSLFVPDSEFLASTKVRRMLTIVQETYSKHAKVLIFSQYTTFLDIIEETLKRVCSHIKYLRLDGSTVVSSRRDIISDFQNTQVTIFLISTRAGGVGLNLTAANTVILMDQDWNPHNDRQAEDRVHRVGQLNPVTVYRLCCRDTIEESILRCAEKKLKLDEAFGGTSEVLTAAILKDCIETAMSLSPKDPFEDTQSSKRKKTESNASNCKTSPATKRKLPIRSSLEQKTKICKTMSTQSSGAGSRRKQTNNLKSAPKGERIYMYMGYSK